MRKSFLICLACLLAALFFSPQPASACQRCAFKVVIIVDEIFWYETCETPPAPHGSFENCLTTSWGSCQEWGDACIWV